MRNQITAKRQKNNSLRPWSPLGIGQLIVDNDLRACRKTKQLDVAAKIAAIEFQATANWKGDYGKPPRFRYQLERQSKRQLIRLCDIQCFHPEPISQLYTLPSKFVDKLDPKFLLPLLEAASPSIGISKKNQLFAASNPTLLFAAQYLCPYYPLKTRLLVKPPTRPLTYPEAASAAQHFYKSFVNTRRAELIAISSSHLEAQLMTGLSKSQVYKIKP